MMLSNVACSTTEAQTIWHESMDSTTLGVVMAWQYS